MKLLIGASASSAIIELPYYIRIFQDKLQAEVRVVVSDNVSNFINPQFLGAHIEGKVYQKMLDPAYDVAVPHSFLALWADMFIVLPCTANTLAKAANGITDNLLTMLILCFPRPVLFFPTMNMNMYNTAVVQANVQKLLDLGHRVAIPDGNVTVTATGEKMSGGHPPNPYTCAKYINNMYELYCTTT